MKLFKSVDSEMESVEGVIKDNPFNRYLMWSGKKIMEHPVIGTLCTIVIPSMLGAATGVAIGKFMDRSGNL